MRFTNLLFLITLLPSLASAIQFSAEGHGESDAEARSNAQAALAESLYVDIRSEFMSRQNNQGTGETNLSITSRSNVPLLGINMSVSKNARGFYAEAALNSVVSLPLYQSRLRELASSINQRTTKLARLNRAAQLPVLQDLLSEIDQFQRMTTVARLLGNSETYALSIDRDRIVQQLQQINARAPSLDVAATQLSQMKSYQGIYVYPPHPRGSSEITQLSRMLRDAIAAKIRHRVNDPTMAKYVYRGEYEALASGIYISYQLVDASGLVVQSNTATLAPEAYDNIAYKPQHVNFDQLLQAGYVQDKNFHASLATNRGSEDLLFQQGESVKLYAKLNRAGYFYIVGHASNDSGNYSYLLELGEGLDNRKFVQYVNADDANKWMELGEFEVAPPFGIESLQLVAANLDLVNQVPDARWDDGLQLFIVSRNNSEAVNKTRALKLKKNNDKERVLAEAVLMLSTSP